MEFNLVKRVPTRLRSARPGEGIVPTNVAGIASIEFRLADRADLLAMSALMGEAILLDRQNQDVCKLRLARCGALKELQAFVAKRPGQAFTPDFVDLWLLYSYVASEMPAVVWEFGSGLSTVVMAFALATTGQGGRLFAIEPDPEWAGSTLAALPSHLRERCDVFYSSAVPYAMPGVDTVRFADLPDEMPSLVYIDGAPKGSRFKGAENVHFVESQLQAGTTIMIDGRPEAVQFFLLKHLCRKWKMRSESVWLTLVTDGFTAAGQPFGLDLLATTMVRLVE